jgi:putative transposase
LSAGELCRKHGISDATFYKWRSRYGRMEVSDARKLKLLEAPATWKADYPSM